MLLLIAYLVAAVTVFNDKPAHQVCRDMELVIKDTLNAGFVTKNEVAAILQKKGIYHKEIYCFDDLQINCPKEPFFGTISHKYPEHSCLCLLLPM